MQNEMDIFIKYQMYKVISIITLYFTIVICIIPLKTERKAF